MREKLRVLFMGILVVAMAAECGPKVDPVEPDEVDETGGDDDILVEDITPEPGPPEPPKMYVGDWEPKADKPKGLEDAEKKFEEKNYKKALKAYRKFIKDEPKNYWVPHATFQSTRCHFLLSEYDEALNTFLKFLKDKPGLLWEARAKIHISALYHALPTYGYERDDKIYYNYEHHEGEYRYMYSENRDTAIDYLEQSRLAFITLLEAPVGERGESDGDDVRLEAVDVNYLLVRDIDEQYWSKYDACPPADPMDPPDIEQPYNPKWSAREKTLFLLDEMPRVNKGRKDTHPEAWALFKKALFLMRYPECPPAEWDKKVAKEREAWESKKKEQWEDKTGKSAKDVSISDVLDDLLDPGFDTPRWNPGANLDPMALIEKILETFPKDRHTELYEATRGRILERRGEYKAAEKVYKKFLQDHPKSAWVGDVQQSLFEMRRPTVSASTQEFNYKGDEAKLNIYTRNLKHVQVDIHEVDLPKILKKKKVLKDHYGRFTDLWEYFKKYKHASKAMKKKVWSKKYKTKDQGDYSYVSGNLDLPTKKLPIGTYFIHIHGGKQDIILPWIKTDIIIVGKSAKDEFRYLITDSKTGAPVPDFPMLIKEVYEKDTLTGWKYKTKLTEVVTDAGGRYTYHLTMGSKIGYNRVQVLANKGRRMAMTQDYSGPYHYSSDTGETFRIFTVTDRPVYRPGDTIQFKHIVRAYRDGKNKLVKDQQITMQITDPKGDRLFDKTVDASAFGNAWGEAEVPDDAPLGVYNARAWVTGHEYRSYQSAGSTFRVEEYKKPEFEVEVLPTKSIATAGDEVKARVKATYYFGAPVAQADVKYKIFRSVFFHSYSPPNRWDWLYGSGFGIVHDRPYSSGEDLIDEGVGKTDDLGELLVKLPKIDEDIEYDYEYKITAEVTDLSRRVINGAGSLKVTRDPYYAYIQPQHGFYTEGDNVEVELLAMTADNEPVAAKGTLEIVKLTYKPGGEIKEKEIDSKKIELDAAGRSFHKFKVEKAGQYRVTFTSTHEKSKEVVKERIVSVAGASFTPKYFKFDKVEVTSQKRTYLRGEKIKLMIQSPWPDATLWVTYEGGDETFLDEVIRPKGVATVLEVEASEQLHPNFFVRVTVVRDSTVHTVSREMFIPPGEEILDVTVKASKDEYKPRSKGKFSIQIKDHKGKPLKGEFSLSVFDSSVLYIQSETAGDIRSYYYGDRRYNDVSEFHSGQIWLTQFTRDKTKWPKYYTMGLTDTGGYFRGVYFYRGQYFNCPSCDPTGVSPWRFEIPEDELKAAVKHANVPSGSADNAPGPMAGNGEGLAEQALSFNGGGGGKGKKMKKKAESKEKAAKSPAPDMAKFASTGVETTATRSAGFEDAKDKSGSFGNEMDSNADPDMIREDFPDTALWVPDVVTGKDGKASVKIKWPDSLTTWAVRVFGVDGKARVGLASTETVTTKKLVARIETPRFMVEGDEVTLAAVVNNAYPEEREVTLTLSLEGGVDPVGPTTAKITVPAGKDARHDFKVRAVEASPLTVKLKAKTTDDSDVLQKKLEIMEWGSDKMVTRMGAMKAPGNLVLELDLPAERRKDTTELVLALDPTVAGVVLRSMPYLIHYPYGCVEQTMSRFLPAAMVARSLKDLGIKLDEIPELAEKATLADPAGKAHGSPQTWYNAPIYDDKELQKIIKKGLKRLYSFQHADGGWAWWKEGKSDPYMTAYVVMGLWEAKQAGYTINEVRLDSGMRFLKRKYKKMFKDGKKKYGWKDVPDSKRHLMTYMAYVLSLEKRVKFKDIEGLYKHRETLTHYGKSLLALTLHHIEEKEKAELAVENLADVAWADEQNQTASFKFEAKSWWRWYNNRIETVAWALRAFTEIQPKHKYGSYFARWLVNNRQGNRWFSTRDTALSILSLNYYMREQKEFDPDYDVTVKVNGKTVKTYHQTRKNIFAGEGRVFLRGDALKGKKVKIEVQTEGKGSIYTNAFLSYFTKEKVIEGAGNEIFLERTYYKLTEKKKKVKTWHGTVTKIDYDKTELRPGDPVKSGDLVEVKIMVESKNDYEYLVFEDFKPAGFEPLALKSGGIYQHGTWINRELRDEKVVNFLYSLEQGKQAITYKLRAEIPGKFRVLPHKAYAMYAPRVKAISDSWHIVVTAD